MAAGTCVERPRRRRAASVLPAAWAIEKKPARRDISVIARYPDVRGPSLRRRYHHKSLGHASRPHCSRHCQGHPTNTATVWSATWKKKRAARTRRSSEGLRRRRRGRSSRRAVWNFMRLSLLRGGLGSPADRRRAGRLAGARLPRRCDAALWHGGSSLFDFFDFHTGGLAHADRPRHWPGLLAPRRGGHRARPDARHPRRRGES